MDVVVKYLVGSLYNSVLTHWYERYITWPEWLQNGNAIQVF